MPLASDYGSRDQLAFNGSQALRDRVASWDARCGVDKLPVSVRWLLSLESGGEALMVRLSSAPGLVRVSESRVYLQGERVCGRE